MATSKFKTTSSFNATAEKASAKDTVRKARIHKATVSPDPEVIDVLDVAARGDDEPVTMGNVTTKDVVSLIAASIFGFVVMSACIALLSAFLWYWLSIVIAFIATLIAGNKFNKWFDVSGYDACVGAARKVGGLFARRSLAAA